MWDDQPVALAHAQTLRAISGAAARAGVRSGMTLAEARARCAELEVLEWDDVAIAEAITEVTGVLLAASPQVTPAAEEPGLWWVGVSGVEAVGGEREIARVLVELARRWHPRARVAIADSCVAARAATWGSGSNASAFIVPAGGDAYYLAPAPLALIPMDGELRATLFALGIGTAGAFAALSAEDVERRWGASGLAAWRLAHGEDRRRPVLATVPSRHAVDAELSSPTTTMEPVLFLVRAALDRLSVALAGEGRAAATIAITLTLDGPRSALPSGTAPHTVTREVRLPRPTSRSAPLFEHCRALLESWPLGAPACGVSVAIVATARATAEQGDLLTLGWRDPAAADAAFARLRAELGPQSVVRPVAADAHLPERAGAWVDIAHGPARDDAHARRERRTPRTPPGGGRRDDEDTSRAGRRQDVLRDEGDDAHPPLDADVLREAAEVATLTLRLLETPEAIEVEWDGHRPCAVWWRERRIALERAASPERLSGEWWREDADRDYWRCESEEGELLIYRDRATGKWVVQGWYD